MTRRFGKVYSNVQDKSVIYQVQPNGRTSRNNGFASCMLVLEGAAGTRRLWRCSVYLGTWYWRGVLPRVCPPGPTSSLCSSSSPKRFFFYVSFPCASSSCPENREAEPRRLVLSPRGLGRMPSIQVFDQILACDKWWYIFHKTRHRDPPHLE